MKRIIAFFSAIALCVNLMVLPAYAEDDDSLFYLKAYSDQRGQEVNLVILSHNGEPYVTLDQALAFSPLVEYSPHESLQSLAVEHNGDWYYQLRSVMDALNVSYYYSQEMGVLVFTPCYFIDDIYKVCQEIYKDGYELTFLDNVYGVGLAALYNILGGLRIDALWGGYQREQYETAVAGILESNEQLDALKVAQAGDKIMGRLSMLLKLKKDCDKASELFGVDIDGLIEAYDVIDGAIPGIGIGEALDILERYYSAEHAIDANVKAIEYGLVNNPYYHNSQLRTATGGIYAYYVGNYPEMGAMLDAAVSVARSKAEKPIRDALIDAAGIKSIYVKAFKTMFDEMGMKERTRATEQTIACADIQTAAVQQYKRYAQQAQDSGSSREAGLGMKYTTILYLRACQYAYSLYSFDDDIAWAADFWITRTQKAMDKLVALDDNLLVDEVRNENLDLSAITLYEVNSGGVDDLGIAMPLNSLPSTDIEQIKRAIDFYVYDVSCRYWDIYNIFGYDMLSNEADAGWLYKINGNPSYEEIETAFINRASEYLTAELIESVVPYIGDSIKVVDGITYFFEGAAGTPEIAYDSFEYAIKGGMYVVTFNYWQKAETPDSVAIFVRQNGKLYLVDEVAWHIYNKPDKTVPQFNFDISKAPDRYPSSMKDGMTLSTDRHTGYDYYCYYDPKGNLIVKESYELDFESAGESLGPFAEADCYWYDRDGNQILWAIYNANYRLDFIRVTRYDENGNQLVWVQYRGDRTVSSYTTFRNGRMSVVARYNELGQLKEYEIWSSGDTKTSMVTYDSEGNYISTMIYPR